MEEQNASGNLGPRAAMSTRDATALALPEIPHTTEDTRSVDAHGDLEDGEVKSDSEAETIVLGDKDNPSPSKVKRAIKHEDVPPATNTINMAKSSLAVVVESRSKQDVDKDSGDGARVDSGVPAATSSLGKRKRSSSNGKMETDRSLYSRTLLKGGSAANSAPASPTPANSRLPGSQRQSPGPSRSPSPALAKSRLPSDKDTFKRKQSLQAAEDADAQRSVRQRSSGAEQRESQHARRPSKANNIGAATREAKSTSPPPRHKRSESAQLGGKSTQGLSHKKKRVPAPLQTTDYNSDDSSTSEGSCPASTIRVRQHITPSTAELAMSPAKLSHKRHVNSSGQTLLARACSAGKHELAQERYRERPETLDQADNANNTPLHFASISGYDEIVRFLLDAGCRVEPVNDLGDTPLHDAVENNHVEVVRMLLKEGANPRKVNKKGDEPTELIGEDFVDNHGLEDATVMRALLEDAKRKDVRIRDSDKQAHAKDSPRQSPGMDGIDASILGASNRATGTIRSQKTSNHLLFEGFNVEDLRKAASQGDTPRIAHILSVNPNHDDVRTLIAAAKGGHDGALSLLFAMGSFDHDPDPIAALPAESSTPMLAAIGRGNIEVIKLLLSQSSFDPSRRFRGQYYYDIARKRAGPVCVEEEKLLREAYVAHKKSPRSGVKHRSPKVRREASGEGKRNVREESSATTKTHKRKLSDPSAKSGESARKQRQSSPSTWPQDAQANSQGNARRTKKDEKEDNSTLALSDRETAPPDTLKKKPQLKKSDPDAASSDTENVKPRRKLISGKDLKDGRERQRRASVTSTTSSVSVSERAGEVKVEDGEKRKREAPLDARKTSPSHRDRDLQGLQHDRSRSLKRDESKDRLTKIRNEQSPAKRARESLTPPRPSAHDSVPSKRRKVDGDAKAGHRETNTPNSSPDATSLSSKAKQRDKSASGPRSSAFAERREASKADDVHPESQASKDTIEHDHRHVNEPEKKSGPQEREGLSQVNKELRDKEANEAAAKRRKEEEELEEQRKAAEREAQNRAEVERRRLFEEQEEKRRQEAERKRIAAQEQARLERIERDKALEIERLSKLPLLLRWFDQLPDAHRRSPEFAARFRYIDGFRFDTINAEHIGLPSGREHWLLNTHVALLLGEKDLQLSRCECSLPAKVTVC